MNEGEKRRLQSLRAFEKEAERLGFRAVAGVDEAGRGPLAGPVVAGACLLPMGALIEGVDDSKKLIPKKREQLFDTILAIPGVVCGIGAVDVATIDEVNIYQATILAMLQAVGKLSRQPDFLLVDGMNLPHPSIPCQKIIKGDSKSQSIAAASILAKVTRDRIMQNYHRQWPHYGFDRHKGYGTVRHLQAIDCYGPCPIHRQSFEPIKSLAASAFK